MAGIFFCGTLCCSGTVGVLDGQAVSQVLSLQKETVMQDVKWWWSPTKVSFLITSPKGFTGCLPKCSVEAELWEVSGRGQTQKCWKKKTAHHPASLWVHSSTGKGTLCSDTEGCNSVTWNWLRHVDNFANDACQSYPSHMRPRTLCL